MEEDEASTVCGGLLEMRLPLPNGEGLEKRAKETARDGSCLIGQLGELPNMATQDGETAKRSAVHPDVRHEHPAGRTGNPQKNRRKMPPTVFRPAR